MDLVLVILQPALSHVHLSLNPSCFDAVCPMRGNASCLSNFSFNDPYYQRATGMICVCCMCVILRLFTYTSACVPKQYYVVLTKCLHLDCTHC